MIQSYFNTSHVTVYRGASTTPRKFAQFQYISCYCLSMMNFYILLIWLNFNTSHVTVYLHSQYQVHHKYTFQYISCYCLSKGQTSNSTLDRISIHLMLLFIRIVKARYRSDGDFNTSHVTVYLFSRGQGV